MSFIEPMLKDLREFDWRELAEPNTIGAWPETVKASVILLVVAALLAGGYLLRLREAQDLNTQQVMEQARLRAEFEQLVSRAADLETYRRRAQALELPYMDMLRQLPYQSEIPALIDDITTLGISFGLEFRAIVLEAEVAQPHYVEQPVKIRLAGAYHDIGAFFSSVAVLDRIVTLHDFSLRELDTGSLELELQVRAYRYRPLPDEPAAAVMEQSGLGLEPLPELPSPMEYAYTAAGGRDPFAPISPIIEPEPGQSRIHREPLEQYSLNSLVLVGLLKGKRRAGLVRDPSGAVHRVEQGDYLGRNGGRIREISERGVELIEWNRNETGAAMPQELLLEWNGSPLP